MGFRDEHESLRAKAEAASMRASEAEREKEKLEQALETAREDDGRDAAEIERLKAQLAQLGQGEAAPAGGKRAGVYALALAFVALLLVGTGVAVSIYLKIEAAPPTERSTHALPAQVELVSPPPAPVPVLTALDRMRFGAVVQEVRGVDGVAVGQGCVIDAPLANIAGDSLQVRCGSHVVFDGATPTGGGMEMLDSAPTRRPGSGLVVEGLRYSLTGQWSGPQAQIQLDSSRRGLRIWQEGLVPAELRALVEGVAVRRGDADGPLLAVHRTTRARLVPGESTIEGLTDCVLDTEPISTPSNFVGRVLARCGERVLYGADTSGWVPAEVRDGMIVAVRDEGVTSEDGDPSLVLEGDTVSIADADWSATFEIEEHPDCTLSAGRWTGALRGVDGALRDGARVEEGRLFVPMGPDVMIEAPFEEQMDCRRGEARLVSGDGVTLVEGRFGPGFATFIGVMSDGELLELYRAIES